MAETDETPVSALARLGDAVGRAAEGYRSMTELSVAELGDRWEHRARQVRPGVHTGKSEALRWLSAGEALAGKVFDRRGEAAAAALMAGASVVEIAAALGLTAEVAERARRRVVRELLIGWARDADRAGLITAEQHGAVLDRLDEAG